VVVVVSHVKGMAEVLVGGGGWMGGWWVDIGMLDETYQVGCQGGNLGCVVYVEFTPYNFRAEHSRSVFRAQICQSVGPAGLRTAVVCRHVYLE